MKFLRVYTDTGGNKPVILFAKIVKENGKTYDIRYFSPMSKKTSDGHTVYNYESIVYTIDDESIVECLHGEDERVIGYQKTQDGWVRLDENDPDYEPSESEMDSLSDSTSMVDEMTDDESEDDCEDEWICDDDE